MTQNTNGIGLFGGTFDPVHTGHLIIAEWLSEILEIEKTYFIPTKIHPFGKRSDITDGQLRIKMLEIAIKDYPHFQISDFELSKSDVSYTIETVQHFKEQYAEKELYYFMGSDNLESFLKWKDPFEIMELCYLVVYQREKTDKPNALLNHPKVLNIASPLINISSSHIRNRISKGMAYKSLVPAGVFEFIQENKLYLS